MTSVPEKSFDAVRLMRAVREELANKIKGMSFEDQRRFMRANPPTDATLKRLMPKS